MPEPYENIYIGTFILGLGYRIGRRTGDRDIMASVNLYQQTPGDPLFGDLLSSLGGKSTLIEFKRSARQLHVEIKQKSQAKADIFSYMEEPSEKLSDELLEISKACHFAGYGVLDDSDRPDIQLIRYLDINDFGSEGTSVVSSSLNAFHDQLLAGEVGVEHREFLDYLSYLSSGGGGGIPMLIVNLSAESKVTILPVETVEVALRLQKRVPKQEVNVSEQEAPQQKANPIQVRG